MCLNLPPRALSTPPHPWQTHKTRLILSTQRDALCRNLGCSCVSIWDSPAQQDLCIQLKRRRRPKPAQVPGWALEGQKPAYEIRRIGETGQQRLGQRAGRAKNSESREFSPTHGPRTCQGNFRIGLGNPPRLPSGPGPRANPQQVAWIRPSCRRPLNEWAFDVPQFIAWPNYT